MRNYGQYKKKKKNAEINLRRKKSAFHSIRNFLELQCLVDNLADFSE